MSSVIVVEKKDILPHGVIQKREFKVLHSITPYGERIAHNGDLRVRMDGNRAVHKGEVLLDITIRNGPDGQEEHHIEIDQEVHRDRELAVKIRDIENRRLGNDRFLYRKKSLNKELMIVHACTVENRDTGGKLVG